MRRPYRYALIGVIVVVAVMGVTVCLFLVWLDRPSTWEPTATSRCPHDMELRTYSQWLRSVTFPFTAPESKLQRVRDNYKLVGVGSSKEAVIQAFGPPDFEQELYPKKIHPPCVGYQFIYYFEKPDGEIVNEYKDKNVQVFFTREGKANWIVGNVGLHEKGTYAHRP